MDRVFCRCDSRNVAIATQGFRFEARYRGWIFPNDAPRSVIGDPWKAQYYGISRHDGEPYVHIVCPYCGNDLPFTDHEPPPPANFCGDDQADGN